MEEIKKIEVQGQQYGVADMLMRSVMGGNAQVIEWSHTHNMNDYKDAGTYRIKGERTGNPLSDNLPIMNQGSGHTIEGILYVLDSSLTNGSGKEDDCTITQFLMLSNRVGGQEGDMYMRSGYGANKDSLTWKPWEKYQTNMEVGVVSDYELLNPSNPTEVLNPLSGMCYLTDNGIYSGIYIPPKALLGTSASHGIKDPTAIETFVMVVINNYVAAGDARCITQIKFAVTNGGDGNMYFRTYNEPKDVEAGKGIWTDWKRMSGSLGEWTISESFGKIFRIDDPNDSVGYISIGRGARIGESVVIGANTNLSGRITAVTFNDSTRVVSIGESANGEWELTHQYRPKDETLNIISRSFGGGAYGIITLGNNINIGKNVTISEGMNITQKEMSTPYYLYRINFPTINEEWNIKDSAIHLGAHAVSSTYYRLVPDGNNAHSRFYVGVANRETGEGFKAGGSESWDNDDGSYVDRQYQMLLSKDNIRFRLYEDYEEIEKFTQLPYGLTIEPSEDGNKLLISYNGKTAELQLT